MQTQCGNGVRDGFRTFSVVFLRIYGCYDFNVGGLTVNALTKTIPPDQPAGSETDTL